MRERCRFRQEIYEQFARIGKAISSPKRLELLDLLAQGERTVEVLAREADLSIANTSQHLQTLKSSGLVRSQKSGLHVVYSLADEGVCDLVLEIKKLAEKRLAEIERISREFMEGHPNVVPVDRTTFLERLKSGDIIVIDVRPREEFAAGHLRGARCVPLDELDEYLDKLPKDRDIVAYCRGPYCVLAIEAVERLRAKGFRAYPTREGVRQWRSLGLEIEQGLEALGNSHSQQNSL